MTDTVRLIIEIPKTPKNDHERWALAHGTPLDDVKAEIDEQYDRVRPYNIDIAQGLELALDILDNIDKAESEE